MIECDQCARDLPCLHCQPEEWQEDLYAIGFVPPEAFATVLEFVRGGNYGLELLRLSLLDYPEVAERVRRFDLEGH